MWYKAGLPLQGRHTHMKCNLCGKRKGRRYCPAENETICPQCCGEKRVLEIDCPESCTYLVEGRRNEGRLQYSRYLQPADPALAEKRYQVVERCAYAVHALEVAIAEERRAARDLTDRELGEALDLLRETLATEERGVLYEQTSENLVVDALRRRLAAEVEALRYPQEADHPRIRLRDAIDTLEWIRGMQRLLTDGGASPRAYVDFLARNIPRAEKTAGPSIILPGQ